MNHNIKYTICFICGILIAHFLLKKNVEGLCPDGGNNASQVDNCNAVSLGNCSNSYSGSGAASVSCYINGSSCNASSVLCGIADPSEEEGESNEQCVKPTRESLTGTSDLHKIILYNLDELPDLTNGTETFIRCKNREYYGKAICDNDGTYRLIDCERNKTINEYPITTAQLIGLTNSSVASTTSGSCINFSKSRCKKDKHYKINNTCAESVCKRSECCENTDDDDLPFFLNGPFLVSGGFCCCVILVLLMLFGLTASAAKSKGIVKSMKPVTALAPSPTPVPVNI
tara:strand:- start:387 stop:1244 length:858 start_codon:yes stop_codon:yes gene_type:complete